MHFPRSPKFDVFISHAGEDKTNIAIPLREKLQKKGITAFVDEEDIQPGENAEHVMCSAMETANIGVIVLSPEFVARKWPMKELLCFLRPQEQAKGKGKSAPTVIPFFYRLSIGELYSEPRHNRTDDDSVRMYTEARFHERMRRGEPEANIDTVKDALEKLHAIEGVVNFLEASNEASYHVSEKRKILLDKLFAAVVLANGKIRWRRSSHFVACVLSIFFLFLLLAAGVVASSKEASIRAYLRWPSWISDVISGKGKDAYCADGVNSQWIQSEDGEKAEFHVFYEDDSETKEKNWGSKFEEGEQEFAGKKAEVVAIPTNAMLPTSHEIKEGKVNNLVNSVNDVQTRLEDSVVLKNVDGDVTTSPLAPLRGSTEGKDKGSEWKIDNVVDSLNNVHHRLQDSFAVESVGIDHMACPLSPLHQSTDFKDESQAGSGSFLTTFIHRFPVWYAFLNKLSIRTTIRISKLMSLFPFRVLSNDLLYISSCLDSFLGAVAWGMMLYVLRMFEAAIFLFSGWFLVSVLKACLQPHREKGSGFLDVIIGFLIAIVVHCLLFIFLPLFLFSVLIFGITRIGLHIVLPVIFSIGIFCWLLATIKQPKPHR